MRSEWSFEYLFENKYTAIKLIHAEILNILVSLLCQCRDIVYEYQSVALKFRIPVMA